MTTETGATENDRNLDAIQSGAFTPFCPDIPEAIVRAENKLNKRKETL
jgi:hypothetical protein